MSISLAYFGFLPSLSPLKISAGQRYDIYFNTESQAVNVSSKIERVKLQPMSVVVFEGRRRDLDRIEKRENGFQEM